MRIKKFLSAKCPVWSGICLSCGQRRRLYCCFAVVGGGSSPCRTWLELLLMIFLNNRSSPSPPAEQSLTDPVNSNQFACSGGGMRQCAGYLYE